MHPEVVEWVSRWATDEPITVLDIGGRNLNGSTRDLFPNAVYTVLDLRPAADVDIVADAATWTPDQEYDLVLCTEVFEHTPTWPDICLTANLATRPGGRFIVTCAGPGRAPHSGIKATPLRPGEYYGNLTKARLYDELEHAGFRNIVVERQRMDLRAVAVK